MPRIHRRLYDPANVNRPLASYLEELVKDILDVSGAKNIVCVVEVPPLSFDLARRVTLLGGEIDWSNATGTTARLTFPA